MKRLLYLLLFTMMSLMLCAVEVTDIREAQNIRFVGKSVKISEDLSWVFWDETLENGKYDVFGMKYGANGNALLAEPCSIISGGYSDKVQQAIPTSDGCFVLGYRSELPGGLSVFKVQKFNPDGLPLWNSAGIQISEPLSYDPTTYLMVANGLGGVHLVYTYESQFKVLSFNSNGTNVFAENLCYSIPGYPYLVDAHSDGNGGMFIHSDSASGSALLRISEDGYVLGANPLLTSSAATPQKFWLKPDTLGQFILHGRNSAVGLPVFSFQKMDVNGNLLLPGPQLHTMPELNFNLRMMRLLPALGGEAYLVAVFQDEYPNSQNRIRVLKLKANMEADWDDGGIIVRDVSYLINDLDLAINASNDLWISWSEAVQNNQDATIYAQRILPGGMAGCPLQTLSSTENSKIMPIVQAKANKVMVWWNDFSGDTNSIRHQIIANNGVQAYNAGGLQLSGKLSGSTALGYNLGLQDNHLFLWMDTRWGNFYKVYYQIMGDQPSLEANGRALNPGSRLQEELHDAIVTPRNTVLLYYSINQDVYVDYYLQEIDANGSKLYPNFGVFIRESNLIQTNGFLGIDGEDSYIFWQQQNSASPISIMSICGQRVVDRVPMWDACGKVILQADETLNITSVHGNYIVYTWQSNAGSMATHVLKIDQNGYPMPGFGPVGVNPVGANLPPNTSQFCQQSWLQGDDLAVITGNWGDSDFSGNSYYQVISSGGVLTMGEPGILVLHNNNSIISSTDKQHSDRIGLLFSNYLDEAICFQEIDAMGNLLCPVSGNVIFDISQIVHPMLINNLDGSYRAFSLMAFEDHGNLGITNISPNGEVISSNEVILNKDIMSSFRVDYNGNSTMLMGITRVEINSREDTSLKGIWALKINPTSAEEDHLVPLVSDLELAQNYPNPFATDTTISYTLQKANSVEISVYNVKGALVRKWQSSAKDKGLHSITWDARDAQGQKVSAGLYFYKVKAGDHCQSRKMVIMK